MAFVTVYNCLQYNCLKIQKYYLILLYFPLFIVNLLPIFINERLHTTLTRKSQLNIFIEEKSGFTPSTACSRKFQLSFCLLSPFVVLFVTAEKK